MGYRLRILGTSLALLLPASAHEESVARLAELEALIATLPDQPLLLMRRADIAIEHGEWDAAERDLRTATRLDPALPELAASWARLHLGAGRPAEARVALTRVLEQRPDDAETLVLRGRASAQAGEVAAARLDYDRALALLATPPPELFLERARLPLAPDELLAGLDQGLATVGPVIGLLERAIAIELSIARYDAALARVAALTAAAESKAPWLRRRGDILATAGRPDEARAAYADALAELRRLPAWLQSSPESLRLATELVQLIPPST